jgi:hypothetical protein
MSAVQATQVLAAEQIGVVAVVQWVLARQATQAPLLVWQWAVAVLLAAHCMSAVQATQLLAAEQIGVPPTHWVELVHWTHAPVVAQALRP